MTSRKRFVRTEPGERIDQRDFQQVAELSPRDAVAQPVDKIIQGDDSTSPGYILSGFAIGTDASTGSKTTTDYAELTGSAVVGTEVRVNRGVALLGFRDRGEVQFGCVLSGGADTKTIDISTFPDAPANPYGVYVRFEFRDEDFQNRIFWNALAVTPVEFPRSISTRRSEDWSMAIEITSPGPEWTKVAEVTKAGGALTVLTDSREWFFEGLLSNAHSVPDSEWGASSDRTDDRATSGLQGMRRFFRAVQKQLQEVIGEDETGATAKWWSRSNSGTTAGLGSRNLSQLNDDKLARDGSQTILGSIDPEDDATVGPDTGQSLGTLAKQFLDIYAKRFQGSQGFFGNDLHGSVADSLLPRITAKFTDTGSILRTRLFRSFGQIGLGGNFNVYRAKASSGSTVGSITASNPLDFVFNATWKDDPDFKWAQDNTAAVSLKFEFWRGGLRIFRKNVGSVTDWDDNSWDSLVLHVEEASNTVEAGTKLTAPEMTTGSLLASTVNVSGLLTAGADALVTGLASAARFLGGASPTTPIANSLYRDNTPKAWAFIKHTGAAGVGAVAFDAVETTNWNIDIASSEVEGAAGPDLTRFDFETPMSAATYSVNITLAGGLPGGGETWVPSVFLQTTASFFVQWYSVHIPMGLVRDPKDATLRYSIQVTGRQP